MASRGRALLIELVALLTLLAVPSLAQAAPPANDNFVAAELLTGSTVDVTGTNVDATKETGEPNHYYSGGRSVWYRWVAPSDGMVRVDAPGATYSNAYAVYTGGTVDGLTRVTGEWGGYPRRFAARSGTVYSIAVDQRYVDATGTHRVTLSFTAAPPNDAFAAAETLTGTAASTTGDNAGATREAGEPSHSGAGYGSAWYTWTAPWTGAAVIDTAGSATDTGVAVYTGDDLGGLVKVAYNDNASTSTKTSRVVFRAAAGTTYRIAVDSPYTPGAFALALRLREAPANDAFASAVELPSDASVTTSGRNDGASAEIGEPVHYLNGTARSSVWYRWTAPKDGSLTIKASANFSTVLAAYQGGQVSDLSRVPNQAQPCSCGPDQIRIRADAGVTYWIAVDSRSAGYGGDFGLSLSLIDRPANDDFADAQLIVGVSADIAGTNLGATQEVGEPVHEQNYYDPSVWYTWTAPETGGVTIDTAGSTFAPVIAVYTGPSVGSLARVPITIVTGSSSRPKRAFRVVAGETYRIAIDGVGAAQGDIKLAFRFRPVPANDMFAAAEPLATGVAAPGDNLGATGEPGEPNPGGTAGATVWYSWTPTFTGPARVSFAQKDFVGDLTVFTGESLSALTGVTAGGSRFRAVTGTTYRIAVHGGSTPNRGTFEIRADRLPGPPNDEFADAVEMSGTSDLESGTNVNATREPGEPVHTSHGNSSVWYRWTAPESGPMTVDLAGSGYDVRAALYTGSAVDSLTKIGSGTKIKFSAVEGTTYRFAVDSYLDYAGTVRIALIQGIVPPNDNFAGAAALTGESDAESVSTAEATREIGEPVHAYNGQASVWYRWTAPRTGAAVIDIAGSFYDSYAVVYSGTGLSDLTSMGGGKKIKFRAVQGNTYYVAVDGSYGSRGPVQVALSMPAGPANDDFDNAVELTGLSDTETGSTLNATSEPGEPSHVSGGSASAWYRWTAPSNGMLTVNVTGSPYTLYTAVYTGSAVNALTRVGSGYQVTVPVTAGTTYRIAVDGEYARMGDVQLSVTLKPPPANDNFADAVELGAESDTPSGTTTLATKESGEPAHFSSGGRSVWYRWTAPRNGTATVALTSSQYYTEAFVYTGDSVGALSRVASGKTIKFRALAGQTYRIAVDTNYGYSGDFELRTALHTPPANDDFANAVELTGDADRETGSSVNATLEPREPPAAYTGGSSVWYQWTAPRSGATTIDLAGSSFDTQISVYTGSSVDALSRFLNAYGKKVSFSAREGTTYRIQVDGYYGAAGSVQLALSMGPRPANDDFGDAAEVNGSTTVAGTNLGATREAGEPAHNSTGRESVWYRWTAPSNGELSVRASGSGFTPTLVAYEGSTLTSLEKRISANGSVGFYVRAGRTYHFAIDTYSGASGPFTLTTSLKPAPPHDDFAAARTLSGASASDDSTNSEASGETGEPSHSSWWGRSVWYRWTAPTTGRATLDLTGSGFDTVSAVYTGQTLTGLSRIASTGENELSFPVIEGQTYSIAVAGHAGATGAIKLALGLVPQPGNDNFAAATALEGDAADATGDNRAATAESGEPAHDGPARHSVWYRWTAPSDGETTVDLSGSGFDTVLAVYTGSAVNTLTGVADDDQAGTADASRVTWMATQGTTYSIAVDSFGTGTGSVALALRQAAAPEPEPVQQPDPPAAQEPPAEDPPAEDPPVDDRPVQDPPVEDPPVEDEPVEDPPVVADPPADDERDADVRTDGTTATSGQTSGTPSMPSTSGAASTPAPSPSLGLSATFAPQTLKAVLSKGLVGTVSCGDAACAITADVALDPAAAKKLGLKAAGAAFGAAAVQANGPTKVVLKLPQAAKRKLAKVKSLKLTVRITARGSGGRTDTATRRITVKR